MPDTAPPFRSRLPGLPGLPGARFTRRVSAITILLFWFAQFSLLTTQRWVFGAGDDWRYVVPRLMVTAIGVGLSFLILALHAHSRTRPLALRLWLVVGAALVAAIIHALANFSIFHLFLREASQREATVAGYTFAVLQWLSAYSAMSGLLLAIVYSGELRDHELQAAQLQREAHSAHLRALRYQLNPHFMFNTLNSIAALVGTGAVGPAERMVENLSDFLRAGLALDPNEDIPLAREIELQEVYLAIEAERFPNRLVVAVDVPDTVRDVLVPSLIVQPLVENAVRHAVAASTAPVTVTIAARREGERLRIEVRDSGGNGAALRTVARGTGVGLTNVIERLRARYGDDGGFVAERIDGGFVTGFSVPLDGGLR